jgi:hypothetical protein
MEHRPRNRIERRKHAPHHVRWGILLNAVSYSGLMGPAIRPPSALVDDHVDVDKVGTGRQTGIPASWEGAGSAEVEVDRGSER